MKSMWNSAVSNSGEVFCVGLLAPGAPVALNMLDAATSITTH
jgi:2-methylaconitate cis-trans-isomerase PrpF